MAFFETVKAKAVDAATMKCYNMLREDFDGNLPKVIKILNGFAGQGDEGNDVTLGSFNMVASHLQDPKSNWRALADHIVNDIDPECTRTFVRNFFVNGVVIGMNRQRRITDEYDCNVPWAILMDPTTACNLHCNGCWAAHYEDNRHKSLSYEELDSVITQGKEMGTFVYLFTGGEPMLRKKDIVKLCTKHSDCIFSAFTNGTLIDEEFADNMLKMKNFIPAISIEGFKEATDSRRGEGTFDKVIAAMDLLRERHLSWVASQRAQSRIAALERKIALLERELKKSAAPGEDSAQ